MSVVDHRDSCDHFPRRDRTDAHWEPHLTRVPPAIPTSRRTPVRRWSFHLLPVAYRFEAGHSIRLAIAGADADHFAPLPGPPPELDVLRGPRFPSALRLPVVAPR